MERQEVSQRVELTANELAVQEGHSLLAGPVQVAQYEWQAKCEIHLPLHLESEVSP